VRVRPVTGFVVVVVVLLVAEEGIGNVIKDVGEGESDGGAGEGEDDSGLHCDDLNWFAWSVRVESVG
jgi:hypothetical protein